MNPVLQVHISYIQFICCCPDVVGCGGAGTTSPGETIKRERVSVVTKVQLQLIFVHWWYRFFVVSEKYRLVRAWAAWWHFGQWNMASTSF